MSLSERITVDLTAAMKAQEVLRLSTLRMVKTALKNREIELRRPLAESEAQQVLATLLKQREEAIVQFTAGGRQELADKEAAEMTIIEAYLPRSLSEAEIENAVREAIQTTGAKGPKDMGTVMKTAMAGFQGRGERVDGKLVSAVVKRLLETA